MATYNLSTPGGSGNYSWSPEQGLAGGVGGGYSDLFGFLNPYLSSVLGERGREFDVTSRLNRDLGMGGLDISRAQLGEGGRQFDVGAAQNQQRIRDALMQSAFDRQLALKKFEEERRNTFLDRKPGRTFSELNALRRDPLSAFRMSSSGLQQPLSYSYV